MNDQHYAIKHCEFHHFADDASFLNFNHSVKKVNKEDKYEPKNLNNWLNANKICLNISKIEVVPFKS